MQVMYSYYEEATHWRHLEGTLARQAIIFAKGHNT